MCLFRLDILKRFPANLSPIARIFVFILKFHAAANRNTEDIRIRITFEMSEGSKNTIPRFRAMTKFANNFPYYHKNVCVCV